MIGVVEALILGISQGIIEWLPLSSGGVNTLIATHFFGLEIKEALSFSLWLHLGTLLAAVFYFREELLNIHKDKALLKFLIITTVVTGLIGGPIILFLLDGFELPLGLVTIVIGGLLVVTGLMQRLAGDGYSDKKITFKDSMLLGLVQGLAVLPGLSRSGITIATLFLRKYSARDALRYSFLASIPIIFVGEIILVSIKGNTFFNLESLVAVVSAFLFGLLAIDVLLKLARKVNFSYFAIVLGIIVVVVGSLI
jgi:undecaprenyl-diphosphatase